MTVILDGIECYILPDCACCEADEEKRNPLDIDECPCGYEVYDDCYYYTEEY